MVVSARQYSRSAGRADGICAEAVIKTHPSAADPVEIRSLIDPAAIQTYRELLHKRPYLALELRGNFDPDLDRNSLQSLLEQEENMKRGAENARRERERKRILEEARAKKQAAQEKQGQIIEEEIPSWDLLDLQPLPPASVTVTDTMLNELARNRAASLKQYCTRQLSIAPERLTVGREGNRGGFVEVILQPYLQHKENSTGDEQDDKTTH